MLKGIFQKELIVLNTTSFVEGICNISSNPNNCKQLQNRYGSFNYTNEKSSLVKLCNFPSHSVSE